MSMSKWVYSKSSREGDGGKITNVWICGDNLVTLDRFNMVVVRNLQELDTCSCRTSLGETLLQVVMQKEICLQLFDNEDSYGVAVFKLEDNQLNLVQEFPIPKVVTSNIIKVRNAGGIFYASFAISFAFAFVVSFTLAVSFAVSVSLPFPLQFPFPCRFLCRFLCLCWDVFCKDVTDDVSSVAESEHEP